MAQSPFLLRPIASLSKTVRPHNTISPGVYIWNGGSTGSPAWLSSSNWSGGSTGTWPGILAASNSGAGHANDIAVFGPGTGAANYSNVGILLNAANGSSLTLGAISSTAPRTLTVGQSGGSSLGTRNLILNGADAGNSAGLSAKTIFSVTDGEVTIRPNVGGGSSGSPLGVRLGIIDGIIDVATGKSLFLNVAITEVTPGSGYSKTGAGMLSLGGTGGNTGATEINAGTVNATVAGALGATSRITVNTGGTLLLSGPSAVTDRINDAATVTLDGGTFNTGGLGEGSRTAIGVGALTLQSTSTIDLDAGSSILHFADSHLVNWTPNNVLEIDQWSGVAGGNGPDQLIFGSSTNGLTLAQIAEIRFYNPNGFAAGTYSAIILANGELVPGTAVAEPATWVAGTLGAWFLAIVSRFKKRRNPA